LHDRPLQALSSEKRGSEKTSDEKEIADHHIVSAKVIKEGLGGGSGEGKSAFLIELLEIKVQDSPVKFQKRINFGEVSA
jgi:hypothetical protein